MKDFFRLPTWPNGQATRDLGGRELIVLPLPGHDPSHIAVHDRRTGVLLTGDTLYPGKLTVDDWNDYRASAARLAAFAEHHPVSLVLGNHIEMKKAPRQLYPIGTKFQPDEHALPLTAGHIREWHLACEAMAGNPRRDVHDDFIIDAPSTATALVAAPGLSAARPPRGSERPKRGARESASVTLLHRTGWASIP